MISIDYFFLLFALGFVALLFLALRNKAVGISGVETRRDDNWLAYWLGVGFLMMCLMICAIFAFFRP